MNEKVKVNGIDGPYIRGKGEGKKGGGSKKRIKRMWTEAETEMKMQTNEVR
jgi:hypothetical protein